MEANQSPSRLDALEESLHRFIRSHPEFATDREISRALGEVHTVKSDYQLIPEEQWQKVQEKLEQLSSPPLQYAVYLGPGQDEENVIVGVGRSRFEVALKEEEKRKSIQPGTEVLINEKNNIVSIGGEYDRGETAEVVNILKPDRSVEVLAVDVAQPSGETTLTVRWFSGKETVLKCPEDLVTPPHRLSKDDLVEIEVGMDGEPSSSRVLRKARPRLHVRSGGSEGQVVEISDQLFEEGVRIGDIVRVEPGLAFAFEKLPAYETGGLELEEVPDVTYDDIGGLQEQVETIRDAVELPYLHRGLFKQYQLKRPKGLFLYGPPGCGKTMVAKAIANDLTQSIRKHLAHLERLIEDYRSSPPGEERDDYERRLLTYDLDPKDLKQTLQSIRATLQAKDGVRSFFLNVKGPELLDKYVGETEHRIRKIFEQAQRRASFYTPVVIFFDEMEAMFRTRGSGRSSDVETTIVPQFLVEIDGVESSENIIIVGASNRPDMIDPAIMRPGRLDIKVSVDRPTRQSAIDVFSLYLLPFLPMQASGMKLPSSSNRTGQVVFRNAYKNASETIEEKERKTMAILESIIPNGLDLRLTTSLRQDDIRRLDRLSHRYLQARYFWQSKELKKDDPFSLKIRQLKPNASLIQLVEQLERFNQELKKNHGLKGLVERYVRNEWIAETYILKTIDILYSSGSCLSVFCNTPSGPRKDVFALKEFISGAVIASIVTRAKQRALKRDAVPDDGTDRSGSDRGLCLEDLREAIYEELDENKEQLAINKIHSELGREVDQLVSVELKMDAASQEVWRETKPRPYLQTHRSS